MSDLFLGYLLGVLLAIAVNRRESENTVADVYVYCGIVAALVFTALDYVGAI